MVSRIKDSSDFSKLYTKQIDRDDYVFNLQDAVGIQIVKKYKNTSPVYDDKRMFIKLFLDGDKVFGGVDMVKVSVGDGWEIIDTSSIKEFRNKISNYFFHTDEGLRFDFNKNKITYKLKEYSVDEIVGILEKTHLQDIYGSSRFKNYLYETILKLVFFIVDRKYKRIDFILSTYGGIKKESISIRDIPLSPDPFFKYFLIYKNLFSFAIGLILFPLLKMSLTISSEYFSIQNPFLFFSAIGFLLLLEGLGEAVQFQINKKDGFVSRLARESIIQKGRLRF